MGYRMPEIRGLIVDVADKADIVIDNGTIDYVSIPCYYQYDNNVGPHNRMQCDHDGWPDPDHPDRSCQCGHIHRHPVELDEIDLPSEGYDQVVVSLLDPPSGLSVVGFIDYNVVNLTITVMCADAESEDLDVDYSVYVIRDSGTNSDSPALRDVITKGKIHIVAGPIS